MAQPICGRSEFGAALMKALGLHGQRVRTIDIHCNYKEPVTVKVERLMVDTEAMNVANVFSDYELTPRPSIIRDFDGWFMGAKARAMA